MLEDQVEISHQRYADVNDEVSTYFCYQNKVSMFLFYVLRINFTMTILIKHYCFKQP